jgi:hypothetical protein
MPEETIVLSYSTLARAIADATDAKLENFKADLMERLSVAVTSAIQTDRDPHFVEALEVAIGMVNGGIIEPVWEGSDEALFS